MPEGAVYVGRPSKWGNPFHTHGDGYSYAPTLAVQMFRETLKDGGFFPNDMPRFRTRGHRRQVEVKELTTIEDIRRELLGKDLACWCPLDQPCHADVLLKIANEGDHP